MELSCDFLTDIPTGNELAHPEGKDPEIKIPKKVFRLLFVNI